MNLSKNRLAAFGAAGALATGSVLAGGVISPASAATTSYDCPTSTGAVLTVPVAMANPFASSYPAGADIGSLPVTMNATLSSTLLGVIGLFLPPGTTSIGGTISDAVLEVGGQSVPLNGLAAAPVPIDPTGMTLPVTGETSPFSPASGSHTVTAPESFTFTPTGLEALALECTAAAPATLGTLLVGSGGGAAQETTTTRAKFLNTPLTTAERPLIRVRVLQEDGDPAAGTVVVKKGKQVLKRVTLNDAGKKRFRIAKLPRGEHRIVFRYRGDADSLASKVVKTIRVRRA